MRMLRFWWVMYGRLLRATYKTFGMGRIFWKAFWGKPLMLFANLVCLSLDRLIHPEFARQRIEKPVFIIGHPRSGSTFLHRFMNETGEFVCFRFWEIVFPALTGRKLASLFVKRRIARGKDMVVPAETGHEQRLESVEEEELLFYKFLNTQFVYVYTPLGFSTDDWDDVVFGDEQPPELVAELFAHLKGCVQRQMIWTKRQRVVANMNYSGMRLRGLLRAFPDARVILLERSPLETIPSHLTLDRNVLLHLWGDRGITREQLDLYLRRRYVYDIAYYRYLRRLEQEGLLTPDRVLKVPYEELKGDFQRAIEKIYRFAELPINDATKRRVERQKEKQRMYRPTHRNLSLEDFGLSVQRLLRDLGDTETSKGKKEAGP